MASTAGKDGEGIPCEHCNTKFDTQISLQWHHEQSITCRAVRSMKVAIERAGGRVEPFVPVVEFDANNVEPPEDPFYDENADLIIEDDEGQLPAHEDDELESGGTNVGSSGQSFDSAMETVLWMNSAGAGGTKLPNRARNEWLKLMKDDRYRLEECLAKWKSHRDMELTIMKAAVGDVSSIICRKLLSGSKVLLLS